MGLGVLFAGAAAATAMVRSEVAVLSTERRVAVRTRLPGWRFEHGFPFDHVLAVRVTLMPGGDEESKVEILAAGGDVECPPTAVPRQEALLLAMMMNVPLIRVSERDDDDDDADGTDDRGEVGRMTKGRAVED